MSGNDMMRRDGSEEFTESGFWEKVKTFAKKAGRAVIERALLLYAVATDPATPLWIRTALYSALAYFISPLDLVPDLTPLLGLSDDMAVMAAALTLANGYITDAHRQWVSETLKRWF